MIKKKDNTPKAETVDDNIKASLKAGKLKDRQKAKKRFWTKVIGSIAAVIFLYAAYVFLFTAYKGTPFFGICRIFLEQQVRYPDELELSFVEHLPQTIRIWYSNYDSFGQTDFSMIDCTFQDNSYLLSSVAINRRDLRDFDADIIKNFNVSVPTILENLPDLTYPTKLPDTIKELKTGK